MNNYGGTESIEAIGKTTTAIYLIVILAAIVINFFIAKKFKEIAELKGWGDAHAFAWCFWLGMIGYIYVAALPQRNISTQNSTRSTPNYNKSYNKFDCISIEPCGKKIDNGGRCMVCSEWASSLEYCRITREFDTKELPLCDECINKMKNSQRG